MAFQLRPAARDGVGVIIGLAGGTGSGKTKSALLLASGLSGGKRFALIDTEAGRAKHYADQFEFDHGDLRPPFRPSSYLEAIVAADEAGYPAIVVDSASHEHAGEGGLLDWHDEILAEMVERKRKFAESKGWEFDEWKAQQAATFSAWIEPKKEHKRFVQRLLQVRAHLILCFRAEEKIEIVTVDRDGNQSERGKTVVRPKEGPTGRDGWMPVCEKNLPYELTSFLLLRCERPGVPLPIKLQEQHRAYFPEDRPITKEAGAALAEWARGGKAQARPGPRQDEREPWDEEQSTSILAEIDDVMGRADSRAQLDEVAKSAASKLSPKEKEAARSIYRKHSARLSASQQQREPGAEG